MRGLSGRVFPPFDLTLHPRDRPGPPDADAARKTPDETPATADECPGPVRVRAKGPGFHPLRGFYPGYAAELI